MKPRERVFAALEHQEPDRVPVFEIWIGEDVVVELGYEDVPAAHVGLGIDSVMLPSQQPEGSNAWGTGLDEFGRIWQDSIYVRGVVESEEDLERYSPPLEYADEHFDPLVCREVKERYPDHCFIYGSHIAPFTMGYLSMGFENFFVALLERPAFVHKLLEARTEWCIAMFKKAVSLGAEVLILGEDGAHKGGPMISPQMWRQFVLPLHRRIVEEVGAPVIWHSDGAMESLLPMAVEAGFMGVHPLEPAAGMDLGEVKREFGEDLVLVGNVDVGVLYGSDLEAVRQEVRRCFEQGAPGGGFMLSSASSIFKGMNAASVLEMFRCARETGAYHLLKTTE